MKKYKKFFKNKKVLITGDTGFKGSWLALWMSLLGARVTGLSNKVPTSPSHFKAINLKKKINHINADICNLSILKKIIIKKKPDYIFHLAAQSLVKNSFDDPINTLKTNTLGTINILEALRKSQRNKQCVAIIITSDKCYENLEISRGYHEEDRLGGKDIYSASKASAEIAVKAYLESFDLLKKNNVRVGIARAGNVIGGGDWAENRLIPDCIKSWSKLKKVSIRNPYSTRPWQHVLEAIRGYIVLAINLKRNKKLHGEAFNFGPNVKNGKNVISLVKEMRIYWKSVDWEIKKKKNFFESKLLKLNSSKSKKLLNWSCLLNFKETIKMVILWYKNFYIKKSNVYDFSKKQILDFEKKIK